MKMALAVALVCILFTTSAHQQVLGDSQPIIDGGTCSHEESSIRRDPCQKHTTVSATLQVSTADIDARQETSFTLKSPSAAQPIVNTTHTSCNNVNTVNVTDILAILGSIQQSVDQIKTAVAGLQAPCNVTASQDKVVPAQYPLLNLDGSRWRMFWWFKADTTWPDNATDVLQDKYGNCDPDAEYCFSRLPDGLQETAAELLGIDSAGNAYRWKFNPDNDVAHAVWAAFHDHSEGKVAQGNVWNPTIISGTAPGADQDSFQYRVEHGVKSLALDDDNCDCYTSLSMGHGMCGTGFSTSYGPENVLGVDLLYDSYCQTPSPTIGLFLYFRDDDDCVDVECPNGFHCIDGIHSSSCRSN